MAYNINMCIIIVVPIDGTIRNLYYINDREDIYDSYKTILTIFQIMCDSWSYCKSVKGRYGLSRLDYIYIQISNNNNCVEIIETHFFFFYNSYILLSKIIVS